MKLFHSQSYTAVTLADTAVESTDDLLLDVIATKLLLCQNRKARTNMYIFNRFSI